VIKNGTFKEHSIFVTLLACNMISGSVVQHLPATSYHSLLLLLQH